MTPEETPADSVSRRPTWVQVLALTWPVLVQQALQYVVSLYDSWLAGRFRPPEGDHVAAQAAQTTAIYLGWFISSYTVLVTVGSTALVARCIGAGDRRNAIHATNQSLLLALWIGLLGSGAGLLLLPHVVEWLQLRGEAAAFALDYLRPLFVLLVFQVIEMAGIACLIGAGDTRLSLWVLGGVALINMPLAWGCYQGMGPLPPLGFQGIAIGTALAHTVGCLTVLIVLSLGRAGLHLDPGQLWPDPPLLRRLLRISVPASADSLLATVGQLFFLGIVNRMENNDYSAAHGIALRWEAISYLAGTAFGTAAMTVVGQNLGARRPDQAARSAWTAFGLAALVMSLCGVVFYLLAPDMFALFCPFPEQQGVIQAGVPVLRIVSFAMVPLACTIVFTAALRGAGDTRVPVLFSLTGFFLVRVPLAYVLTSSTLDLGIFGIHAGANLGLAGAWLAMCADLLLRGTFFLLRFLGGRWQHIEV